MPMKQYDAFVRLFADILREEFGKFDMLWMQDSDAGQMIFGKYKMDTSESEDAAWEEFWAKAEKAFKILFKENMYE